MKVSGFLCGPRIYNYAGWTFEVSGYNGPWPLRKDGELRKRAVRKFYSEVQPFFDLCKPAREMFRVGGGCQPIQVEW